MNVPSIVIEKETGGLFREFRLFSFVTATTLENDVFSVYFLSSIDSGLVSGLYCLIQELGGYRLGLPDLQAEPVRSACPAIELVSTMANRVS